MAASLLLARLCRERCLLRQAYPWATQCLQPVNTKAEKPGETFWNKNDRLKRPLSPDLSIYKPQMTWMMSITHRITGLIVTGMVGTFAIGALMLPASFPYYVQWIQILNPPPALIYMGKCCIAFPLVFHFHSGIRHLVWDMGIGFKLKNLYQSAYAVIAITLVLTLGIAAL